MTERERELEAENSALRWLVNHRLEIHLDRCLFEKSGKATFYATWFGDDNRHFSTLTHDTKDEVIGAAVRMVREESE